MTPVIIYFLKANIAIILFYGFYRLFFHKDTFFQWKRIALLSFLAISFLYPLLNIQDWVREQEPMVAMADIYATTIMPDVVITATPLNWGKIISSTLLYLYAGVCVLLFFQFIFQLGRILKFRFKSTVGYVNDTKIRILTDSSGPFSFFKWIFIRHDEYSAAELEEIITHELTHARQWHSIDVVISELICIMCWFNPFAWLIRREIRCNLEYLADNKVLTDGYDIKTYQYHLLGLNYEKKVATLYNNFNVLPLKNRIKMMNKKRTKKIGRAKYFVFPLLAALMLIISNIETIARTTTKVAEEITYEIMTELPVIDIHIDQEDPIFDIVEQMPEFPGGSDAMMKYISKNIKYPAEAQKNGTQGRVFVSYVVEKDGSLTDVKIERSVDPELDKESLRVISTMPKWSPGKQRGQTVRVKITMPITFSLLNSEPENTTTSKL